jgi:hypothetical protein
VKFPKVTPHCISASALSLIEAALLVERVNVFVEMTLFFFYKVFENLETGKQKQIISVIPGHRQALAYYSVVAMPKPTL